MPTVPLASDGPEWTHHTFVWPEAGPPAYRALVGSILAPPLWDVRYAMFDGDVAARAEEWRSLMEPGGTAWQVRHAPPQAPPRAPPGQQAARGVGERPPDIRFCR